jgi:fatty-acyl-CoA synthase
MALCLQRGDHIAVWAVNLPEWILLEMAAAKAGLVLVTVNPVLRATEVEYILKQSDARALFFMARIRDHDCLATLRSLTTPGTKNSEVTSERLPMLRYVSLMGAPPAGLLEQDGWRPTLFREMVAGGAQMSDAELSERQASVKPTDAVIIMYTSGTTGLPKGAMLTHRGIINDLMLSIARAGNAVGPGDRYCLPAPFFHIAGAGIAVSALAASMTLHPLLAFDPLKVLQIISTERCNLLFAVPTMLIAILQHPDFNKYPLSSLKFASSAGCVGYFDHPFKQSAL